MEIKSVVNTNNTLSFEANDKNPLLITKDGTTQELKIISKLNNHHLIVEKGNRKFFTVGAGLKYNVIGLNFAYLLPSGTGVNRNPLSNTLRFSLSFDLDKDAK